MIQPHIAEEPNVFDDHLLDIIGREFKFSHPKGIAEWLKNSADGYVREGFPDSGQFMVIRFCDGTASSPVAIECLDFVGMTREDIDRAFKRWGDPEAAKRGADVKTFGGHGNGGKFYMRQMFEQSYFVTYRNGRVNVFGFSPKKRYGYDVTNKDRRASAADARALAGLDTDTLPQWIARRLGRAATRFTLVRGVRPAKIGKRIPVSTLCRDLCNHPHSRRLLQRKRVCVIHNGEVVVDPLAPEEVEPKPGFEDPARINMPATIENDGETLQFLTDEHPEGYLILRTSREPFPRHGERSALNSIDILGEVGVVAWYRINELGFLANPQAADFIYGECYCPIIEDPGEDCVRNDRERLIDNARTRGLLAWIRDRVDELAARMVAHERAERRAVESRLSRVFNQVLNDWKNRFMPKLFAEIFAGPGVGPGAGGQGSGGSAGGGGTRAGGGTGSAEGGGTGEERKRGRRSPIVLLSSSDPDPLAGNGATLDLSERHPAVYQRVEDVREGIYWINTSRPMAREILDRFGPESTRWRDYLFQRYVDIIIKAAIHEMGRQEVAFRPDTVDELMDAITMRVHDSAAEDLDKFLFDEE